MKAVQKQSKSLGGWVKKNSKQFKGMGLAIAAMGAAALLTFKKMVKQYVETGDMIHKMAIRTGFAAETLSELAYAADISGADINMLEKGVKKMSKTIVDASYGLETYLRVFRGLGIEIEDIMELSPEEQFLTLGAAISKMENQTLKTAAAVDIFGRAGTMLLPFFAEGAEGMAKLREEAHTLGIIFDEEMAAKAAKLKDAQTALSGSVKGLSIAILNDLIPVLTTVTKEFTDWFVGSREDARTWTDVLLQFFKLIAQGVQTLMLSFNALQALVFQMGEGVTKVFREYIEKLIIAFGVLEALGAPVKGLMVKLVKAWADLRTIEKGYWAEADKHTDTMADIIIGFEKFFAMLDKIKGKTKEVKTETKAFGTVITDSVLPPARKLGDILKTVVTEGESAVFEMKKSWEDTFNKILGAATLFTSSLGNLFSQMHTNEMQRIENEYQRRKELIDASLMNDQAKYFAIERLDREMDKKRLKAQRKQAKRTKAIALMEAIVNTAAAVVQAMKAPFPLSLILPIIIGAMGAAQIALIAAQPLPTFAKGGRLGRGEPGIVGEEGPELFAPDTAGTIIPIREGAGALRPVYVTIAPTYQISTIDEIGVRDFMRDRGLSAIVEAIKLGIKKPELQDALRIK